VLGGGTATGWGNDRGIGTVSGCALDMRRHLTQGRGQEMLPKHVASSPRSRARTVDRRRHPRSGGPVRLHGPVRPRARRYKGNASSPSRGVAPKLPLHLPLRPSWRTPLTRASDPYLPGKGRLSDVESLRGRRRPGERRRRGAPGAGPQLPLPAAHLSPPPRRTPHIAGRDGALEGR